MSDSLQSGDALYFLGNKNLTMQNFDASTTAGDTVNGHNIFTSMQPNNGLEPDAGNAYQYGGTASDVVFEMREPTDLGEDFYRTLVKFHTERTKETNPTPDSLICTWEILKKSMQNLGNDVYRQKGSFQPFNPCELAYSEHNKKKPSKISIETQIRLYGKTFHDKETEEESSVSTKKKLTQSIDYMDIRFTVNLYHKQFLEDNELEQKMYNGIAVELAKKKRLKQEKKQARIQKRIQYKLSNKSKTPAAAPTPEQETQAKVETLVPRTVLHHREKVPEVLDFVYPDKLFTYWKSIPMVERQALKIDLRDQEACDVFHNYYNSRIDTVNKEFKKMKGVECNDGKVLYNFFKNECQKKLRRSLQLEIFDDVNGKVLFKQWMTKKLEQQEEERQKYLLEYRSAVTTKTASKKKHSASSQKQALSRLCKPKDRLKLGKTMLKLKAKSPNDRILEEMILEEFTNEKIAKKPLEYEFADSDQEERVRLMHLEKIDSNAPHKDPLQEEVDENKLKPLDFEIERRKQVEQLLDRFKNVIQKYTEDKDAQIQKNMTRFNNNKAHLTKIENFIIDKAKAYKQITRDKMNAKQATETQFLSSTYQEMKNAYPEGTKIFYPHVNYGESEELKKRSYPLSFKHDFFRVYRTLNKEGRAPKNQNSKGFWAPAGKHYDSTHNKKIEKDCLLVNFDKMWEERVKDGIWEQDEFMDERQQLLMKLDDAKNCSFRPWVRSRLPQKMKIAEIQGDKYNKANLKQALETLKNSADYKNLEKQGRLIMALTMYQDGQIVEAYESICSTFNVPQIREHFMKVDRASKSSNPGPISGLKLDGVLKSTKCDNQEDFKAPKYQTLLREVYDFVSAIEFQERETWKASQNAKKAKSKITGDSNIKEFMCPLGTKCPSYKNDRWPMSNKKGIEPLAKDCPFAHHSSELRFQMQEKIREKLLTNLEKKLEDEVAKGHFKVYVEDKYTSKLPGGLNSWNPGGANLKDCINKCGKCAKCMYMGKYNEKADHFEKITFHTGMKMKNSKKVAEKIKAMRIKDENMRKKISYLRVAEGLYNKERYKEAFETIVKAIEIIKDEMDEEEADTEDVRDRLREKLDLDPEFHPTKDQILKLQDHIYAPKKDQNASEEVFADEEESEVIDENFQKVVLYAQKMGIIGENIVDVNKHTKMLIEDTYNKIVKKMKFQEKGITCMKTQISKIEKELEIKEDPFAVVDDKTNAENNTQDTKIKKIVYYAEMCPNVQDMGMISEIPEYPNMKRLKCADPNCKKAHRPQELDLVPAKKKEKQLKSAVAAVTEKLIESTPFKPWRVTGEKDTIEAATHPRHLTEILKKKKLNSDDDASDEEEFQRRLLSQKQGRDIYLKDIDQIKKYPWAFPVRDKDEYNTNDGPGPRGNKASKPKAQKMEGMFESDESYDDQDDKGFNFD